MGVGVEHPRVTWYLSQLDAATAVAGLADTRRAELRAEILAHVDEALGSTRWPSDVEVADVLDRLGPVEEIVAAEVSGPVPTGAGMAAPGAARPGVTGWEPAAPGRGGWGYPAPQGPGPRDGRLVAPAPVMAVPAAPWGGLEYLALGLLTVGAVLLPVVGSVAGVCCAWASRAWTRTAKVTATVLGLLPPVLLVCFAFFVLAARAQPAPSGPVTPVQQPSYVTQGPGPGR